MALLLCIYAFLSNCNNMSPSLHLGSIRLRERFIQAGEPHLPLYIIVVIIIISKRLEEGQKKKTSPLIPSQQANNKKRWEEVSTAWRAS